MSDVCLCNRVADGCSVRLARSDGRAQKFAVVVTRRPVVATPASVPEWCRRWARDAVNVNSLSSDCDASKQISAVAVSGSPWGVRWAQ